jgi:hypothetical protein
VLEGSLGSRHRSPHEADQAAARETAVSHGEEAAGLGSGAWKGRLGRLDLRVSYNQMQEMELTIHPQTLNLEGLDYGFVGGRGMSSGGGENVVWSLASSRQKIQRWRGQGLHSEDGRVRMRGVVGPCVGGGGTPS